VVRAADNRRVIARVWLVSMLAVAGCDGSGPPADAGSGCSGSLSGAITETILDCKVTWSETGGISDIGNDGDIAVSDPSLIVDFSRFGFVLTVNGDPHADKFSTANVTKYAAGVNVQNGANVDSYIANFNANPMGPPNLGSLAAEVTHFAVDPIDGGATSQWVLHGNLTATLVPAPGATGTGTIEMSLVF
jgi:hypothetical protein